jgi:hypothetical protein
MNKRGQKYVNPERQSLSDQKEKLREAKKIWNKSIKEFIPELIKFKQLMNGRTESKERVRLYEPFPEDSISKLDALTDSFKQKTESATQIISFQNSYSENYNKFYSLLEQKRKNKLQGGNVSPSDAAKAANTLSSSQINKYSKFDEYALLAEGIHPLSLGWETVKSFFNEGVGNSRRISLMRQIYDIDQKCSEIQNNILNARTPQDLDKSKMQVFSNIKVLRSIKYSLELLARKQQTPDAFENEATPDNIENLDAGVQKNNVLKIQKDLEKSSFYEMYPSPDTPIPPQFYEKRAELSRLIRDALKNTTGRRSSEIIQKYEELIKTCFPKGDHKTFSSYEEFKGKRAKVHEKYNGLIRLAQEEGYDPITRKIKNFFARIGLKAKVFFKIKGNLEYCASEMQEVRRNNNEIIINLKNNDADYNQINTLVESSINTLSNIKEELDSARDIIDSEGVDEKQFKSITDSVEKSWLKNLIRKKK